MNQDEAIEVVQRIVKDRALQLKHGVRNCLLCEHRRSVTFAPYIPAPREARALRQQEGKQRVIIYGLCSRCMELGGKEDLAEAKIRERYRVVN